MLKTIGLSVELAPKADIDEIVNAGGGKADKTNGNSLFQNLSCMSNIGAMGEPNFITPDIKKAFNRLKQVFIKALILQHFDPESHIWIKTDASGYAIGEVLSQLNTDIVSSNFSQWHPIAYYFKKMISIETQYKTHNTEFLAIVEAFKT